MIDLKKEEEVRAYLNVGFDDKEIARLSHLQTKVVSRIRKTREALQKLTNKQKREIQELLILHFPIKHIELKTKIRRDYIYAVRRHYYLNKRKIGAGMVCPTCGCIRFSDTDEILRRINEKETE